MKQNRLMWVTGALVAASSALVGVAAATADAPAGSITPHRHFIEKPDGTLVPVGPDACPGGVPTKSHQFDNFHNNVHRGRPGEVGRLVALPGCG